MGATGGLELVSTFTAPNATISSLDFSPQNGYLYYIATTGNSAETPNTIQHRLRRLSLPGLTNPQNVLNGATEVRRTVQGHLLVTRGQEVRTLSAPNAPTVPAVLASMATNYTWPGGPNNPLQTNVALQPIITHAEQGVAHRTLGRKHYELTDHLGNVRVVVSDVKLSTLDGNNEPYAFVADVVSRTDFYAHGSAMPGRHYPGSGYRYGFNGKELDETGHYDFDARNFDARIGRFTSIDPYGSFFPSHNPYQYALNIPTVLVDEGGNYPKPSAALAKIGIKLPALAAGMLDAMVDNMPFVGAVGFTYDLITDPEFRAQTIEMFCALATRPIEVLSVMFSEASGVVQRIKQGVATDEDYYAAGGMAVGAVGVVTGGAVLIKKLLQSGGPKIIFTADLSQTKAKSRSGHRNAGNKQINEKMQRDPSFRREMEKILGSDALDRTSTSGKGRVNPKGFEWDHNNRNPNRLDLISIEDHKVKTKKDGKKGGGWKRHHKRKMADKIVM